MPTHETLSEIKSIKKYNPATGALLFQFPFATAQEIQAGLSKAHVAQKAWASTKLRHRVQVLEKVEQLLRRQADQLIHTLSLEVGKPQAEALQADLLSALAGVQHVIGNASKLNPQLKLSFKSLMLGRVFKEVRVPYGVVSVISPWNYPIGTPAPGIANALVAGNAVAFKPSEKTPKSGELLARVFQDALEACGFSADLVQLFQGDGSVGNALVQAPETAFVFFTGSEAVGRDIQRACASRNIPCSLELGSSDAMVILPSAERYSLDAVVAHAILGRYANAGQTCAAIKKLYVPTSLLPIVQELLVAKLSQLRVGDPFDPSTHLGPVIDTAQQKRLNAQWQDALDKGITPVYGQLPQVEEIHEAQASFLAPMLVINPPKDSRIVTEEVFGPILPVFTYDDLSQVIDEINASPYGLGASIFGKPKQAEWLGKQLNVANVAINDLHMIFYTFPQVTWRGLKQSGPGLRNGQEGIVQFSQVKTFGKAFLFDWLPFTQKGILLFNQGDNSLHDSKALLDTIGKGHWWNFFSPKLFQFLAKNQGNSKL